MTGAAGAAGAAVGAAGASVAAEYFGVVAVVAVDVVVVDDDIDVAVPPNPGLVLAFVTLSPQLQDYRSCLSTGHISGQVESAPSEDVHHYHPRGTTHAHPLDGTTAVPFEACGL